jgi:hypothetical protein
MPHTSAPATPAPALFDVTSIAPVDPAGTLARIPLEELELAPNARREIDPEGIERLARMLASMGQLVPCIGHRPAGQPVVLYAGQRRLLAASASHTLDGVAPIRSLIVLLLDHAPSIDEVRRIQAHENQREDLTLTDQQEQFRDCWAARAGLRDEDRIAAVCSDLGIGARKAHNLRRQLTLPEAVRIRVAERPSDAQLSVTMANRLADMHELAPELTAAVAARISSPDLHERALADLGAFVHRTVVEDETVYAVRIDDGALLDAAEQLERARAKLTPASRPQAARLLGCAQDKLDRELDALASKARSRALKIHVDAQLRDRAANARYAWTFDRGRDFARGIWVVDPLFMLDVVRECVECDDGDAPAREESYFAGARLHDADLRAAAAEDREQRAAARQRRADATASNLGLGHDIRAGLADPSAQQLDAVRQIVCRLLAGQFRDVIAYGAGWTDRERQQPVGDTGRSEPRQADAVAAAEVERALADPDPLHGIAQLVTRWAAAFILDADGVTKTTARGADRMARRLGEALPDGDHALRVAVWTLMRPMLSPRLASLNADAFLNGDECQTTVDLAAHRREATLDDLDLDDGAPATAAA